MSAYRAEVETSDGWTRWIQPVIRGYKMACCDCGLVHSLNFRVSGGRVQFQASRNARATGQKRRWMGKGGSLVSEIKINQVNQDEPRR